MRYIMKYERNIGVWYAFKVLSKSDRFFRAQVEVLTILTNGFFNFDD